MVKISEIGFSIVLTTRSHYKLATKLFSVIGLYRGSPPILLELGRKDGITQAELAEKLELSQPTMTDLLTKLESAGLIVRQPNNEDGRSYLIYLTEAGRKKLRQCIEVAKKTDKITFSGFSPEELEMFHHYLERVHQNLKEGIKKI